MSRIRIVGAALAAMGLLASLSGTALAAPHAAVRLWNVISTKQTVDLLIDDVVVLHDVAYGTVTDRVVITPGNHSYQIRDSNTDNLVGSNGHRFPAGTSTTISLPYLLGQSERQDELTTIDDVALVRVWAITDKTSDLSPAAVVEGGETLGLIDNVFVPSDYIKLTPGTHHLSLVNPDTGNARFQFPVTVEAATNYTVFIWDAHGTTLANLVVDAENVSDSAVGITAGQDPASILGLGIVLVGFTSWLAVSSAWRRKRLG